VSLEIPWLPSPHSPSRQTTLPLLLCSHCRDLADDDPAVVSQATHICDLARYLAPPPVIDSIHVHTVEHTDPAGKLSLDFDEIDMIAIENRIPRITNAIWQWEGGATGHLLHGVALAGMLTMSSG